MATAPTDGVDIELRGAIALLDLEFERGDPPPECLVVGAAGTGKTWGILFILHMLSLYRPNMRILICRKTRAALTESVLVTYEQEVLPVTGHRWMAEDSKRRVRQSYAYPNGTEWIVGGIDTPSRILSTSYDLAFVNEAIELEEEDWEMIQSRIGRPDRSHSLNCIIGDTNPGVPSHWLKARCDRGQTEERTSRHQDNPSFWREGAWTPAGESYRARLARLTGARYKRLYEGLWAAGESQWFTEFGPQHVSAAAEYRIGLPLHVAVDSGFHTGVVWFQIVGAGDDTKVHVFRSWYTHNRPAYDVGREVLKRTSEACHHRSIGRFDRGTTDPAGDSPTGIGTTVFEEYRRAGLNLDPWPRYPGSVADGLALIESFVSVDPPGLLIHPRCTDLIAAFENYCRKKQGGQFIDKPVDPQHPHEELIDALRGGLMDAYPEGRKIDPVYRRVKIGQARY